MATVKTIDGSLGEGGGQILRTSVALSIVTGTPIIVTNIRANRSKPGLRRQHLTAIRAAAQISQAEVEGLEIGASTITFSPSTVRSGTYVFDIGSAGSTTLVLQTVVWPLMFGSDQSTITCIGGTHNPMSPPFEFLNNALWPLVRRMGASVTSELLKYGFYPRGGGRIRAEIDPIANWNGVDLTKRGRLLQRRVTALVAKLPRTIAKREIECIRQQTGWKDGLFDIVETDQSGGPGNVVTIHLQYENVDALFTGIGRRGKPAETVAMEALESAMHFDSSKAVVTEHLADQLLLPMSLAAHFSNQRSQMATHQLTGHATTQIELLPMFLDVEFAVESIGHDLVRIVVQSKR